jgi:hypothetical protein
MTRKINAADLPEFDLAEMLKTEQDIATYLTLATEGDVSELSHALDIAARAPGMAEIAKGVGSLVDFMRNSPLHGMAWHGMAWHGMAWHGMEDIAFERDTSLTRA